MHFQFGLEENHLVVSSFNFIPKKFQPFHNIRRTKPHVSIGSRGAVHKWCRGGEEEGGGAAWNDEK